MSTPDAAKLRAVERGASMDQLLASDVTNLRKADLTHLRASVTNLLREHEEALHRCLDGWASRLNAPESVSFCRDPLEQQRAGPAKECSDVAHKVSTQSNIHLPGVVDEAPAFLVDAPVVQQPSWMPGGSVLMQELPSRPSTRKNVTKWAVQIHSEQLAKTLQRGREGKFKNDKRHAGDYLTPVAREAALEHETWLEGVVTSQWYECASVTFILLNALIIGIQVQTMAMDAQQKANDSLQSSWLVPAPFLVFNYLFCVIFAIDLGLRWYVDGLLEFFQTKDRAWNAFDLVIVLVSIVEIIIELASDGRGEPSSVSMIRVLRIIRVVRVLRVIKVISFFRELRMMIGTILSSMTSVLWVAMTFGLIFFIFGTAFTMAVAEQCSIENTWTSTETEVMRQSFGTLEKSALTLFMSISGGQDWGMYFDVLKPLSAFFQLMFILYMFFAFFAVINVVTGVFVEGAMQSSTVDREHVIQQEMEAKLASMQRMRELFEELDTTNNGSVTLEEFHLHLDDPRVVSYLHGMKLEFDDTTTLFQLLDADGSGEVSFEEFCAGCERLKGNARSMDLAMLRMDVAWLGRLVAEVLGGPWSPSGSKPGGGELFRRNGSYCRNHERRYDCWC